MEARLSLESLVDELRANNREMAAILEALWGSRAVLDDISRPRAIPTKRKPPLNNPCCCGSARRNCARHCFTPINGHSHIHAVNGHQESPGSDHETLSKREREVLALIVAGRSSKRIAVELGISFKTAVTHRASIMAKMQVHEIASLVREAIRRGLV